jgi:hypothetical protein
MDLMDEPSEEKTHEKVSKANAIFASEVYFATDVRGVLLKLSLSHLHRR